MEYRQGMNMLDQILEIFLRWKRSLMNQFSSMPIETWRITENRSPYFRDAGITWVDGELRDCWSATVAGSGGMIKNSILWMFNLDWNIRELCGFWLFLSIWFD